MSEKINSTQIEDPEKARYMATAEHADRSSASLARRAGSRLVRSLIDYPSTKHRYMEYSIPEIIENPKAELADAPGSHHLERPNTVVGARVDEPTKLDIIETDWNHGGVSSIGLAQGKDRAIVYKSVFTPDFDGGQLATSTNRPVKKIIKNMRKAANRYDRKAQKAGRKAEADYDEISKAA